MMKILYFQHSIQYDGSTNALLNYLNVIKKNNCVKVIVARKSIRLDELEEMGIDYMIVPFRFSSYRTFNLWYKNLLLSPLFFIFTEFLNFYAILRLMPIIRSFKPDIIHSNVGPLRIGYYLARLFNIKHVWHLREFQGCPYTTYPIPTLSVYKHLLRKSSSIAISNCISKYYNVDSTNSTVIYDGVFDAKNELEQPSFLSRGNRILFVGRVEPAKGVEDLIYAFISISNDYPDLTLDLLGNCDNSYRNFLNEKYIRPYNLEKRILFHGASREVDLWMRKAKVTVVSSLLEGFGFVVAESMYNYCIVIGNDNTGIKEQFDRCDECCNRPITRRYTTVEELKSQLYIVLDMPSLEYDEEAMELHKCVVNLYDKKRYANNIQDFYTSVVQHY